LLTSAYREIQDIKFPVVATTSEAPREEEPEEAEAAAPGDGNEAAPAPTQTPAARTRKEPDTTLNNVDEFVEFFVAAGRKGIAVNRYKGLGEMNPDTLWRTARCFRSAPRTTPRPTRCSRP
jgi:DNA gyrase subunit B